MEPTTLPTTLYEALKLVVIVAGMCLVACGSSACGVKVGESTLIGTPGWAQTVYAGELQLQRQRRAK